LKTKSRFTLWALAIAALLPLASLLANGSEGGYRLLELDGYKVKWGEHSLGAGASVSYAFADEDIRFDNARNCGDMAPMAALSGPSLPYETLERETAAAFRIWERAANLSFHKVDDVSSADIILGAQGRPHGRAFANVTFGPDAKDGVRVIDQALVCLNPTYKWKVGFDGNKDVYDLRYTLIHEIGHAIGLDHPGPGGQIMGFRYSEAFSGLQPGDLRGVRRLYGYSANPTETELASTDSSTYSSDSPATVPVSAPAPAPARARAAEAPASQVTN